MVCVMTTLNRSRLLCLIAFSFFAAQTLAHAAPPDHWVGTWATADVDRPNTKGDFGATDMSFRQIVHLSIGGPSLRVELSNRFGTEPLTIGDVHVALAAGPGTKGEIALPTANAVTFGGHPSIVIPPGALVVSDSVGLTVEPFADLVISIFLPAQKISHLTVHGSAYQTNYIAPGNVAGEKSLPADGTKTTTSWFFLKAVDVKTDASSGAVIAFGDSITDGTYSTPDQNKRWPDFLARRLHDDKKTAGLGVLNLGIGGNRVINDVTGPSALARFDDDVLAQSGVRYLILLESINDIGHAFDPDPAKRHEIITADDLIQGLTQLAERAHAHGIKVFGATLTPYLGAGYASPQGEVARKAVNQWIRTSKALDGVIDFEAATIDKATGAFDLRYNAPPHPDHLHPNDAGMEAMANAIDLKLFTEK